MADDVSSDLPTDILVDILVRLPTSARRRFRLVCKRWRDVIDERTAERQVRTKILVFNSKPQSSRVLVFGDEDRRRMHEWTYGSAFSWGRVDMVGTSNGLICLHDSSYGDRSTITIANPITGEALALPPVPRVRNSTGSFGSYGFGYHPTTGQYKVVHVPSCVSLRPDTVHVLTLGCSVWRKAVPSMADVTYYDCSGGVVCVDGSAYWFSLSGNRVVALDLKDERLTSFPGPPGMRSIGVASEASFKLTSVNARLGVVFPSYKPATTRVVVWILDGGGEEQPRWSRRYTLIDRTTGSLIVLTPHLTHGKDILTMSRDMDGLYRHKVGDCTDVDDGRTAQLVLSEGIELIISEEEGNIRTFAYVETQEPLPIVRESRSQKGKKKKLGQSQSISFHRIK